MRRGTIRDIRAAALPLLLFGALAAPAGAATITVNSTADTTSNDGVCTLREAIVAANGNAASGATAGECTAGEAAPVEDSIGFAIAGAGPHLISPATALPAIVETAVVDGGTDGTDEIRIDGGGTLGAGFDVEGSDIRLRELTITRFIVAVDLAGSDDAEVEDSSIGTTQAGTAGLGNTQGIRVGVGTAPATGAAIGSNVISGNTGSGIRIGDSGSDATTIVGNRIGTSPAGTAALANGIGVEVTDGADDTVIGGATPAEGNLISGNTGTGIEVNGGGESATGTVISSNRIGTGVAGEAAVPNLTGITLAGPVAQTDITGNLISGNTSLGIQLAEAGAPSGAPDETTIAGNLIGTDDDGVEAIGNGAGGITAQGTTVPVTDTLIGGTAGLTPGGACTGDCNVIAANGSTLTSAGILVGGPGAAGTGILGNHIGVDSDGAGALGNAGRSIVIGAAGAGIQVGAAAAGNVIAASGSEAIILEGNAGGVSVKGNLLGTGSDGASPLGNGSHGIVIRGSSSGNTLGGTGPGEGNTIRNSDDAGVRIEGTADANAVLGNSIAANGGLGIDLFGGIGADPNDELDQDDGPNGLQNHPVLVAAVAGGGETVVAGSLDSSVTTDYRIEVFANAVADDSGFGEGETFLGAFTVTTGASGEATFAEAVGTEAGAADSISATATELGPGDVPQSTSEFGPNVIEGCDNTPTAGADTVTGTDADEVLCGLGGNDTFIPAGGDDVIVGGDGDDELDLSDASAGVDVDLAAGQGATGPDELVLAELEDVVGSAFADELSGDTGANTLDGGDKTDTLVAGGGADTVLGQNGADTLRGEDGADVLKGADGADTVKGQAGADTLKGQDAADQILGGDGADTLKGGRGRGDDLDGGRGRDSLDGGADKKDVCDGGADNDVRKAPGCETERSIP